MRFPVRELFRHEFRQLLVAGLAVFALTAFLGIAELVEHGTILRFDDQVLLTFRNPGELGRPVGPAWLLECMLDITALGGATVITLVTVVVAGLLALKREYRLLGLVALTAVGGALLETSLKLFFGRPRPAIVPHLIQVHAQSFPSGHSMMSSAVYLSLAALLARRDPSPRTRAYILSIALGLVFLIGLSRVYLGVHYPTDVLGGWLLGCAWAALCWVWGRSLRQPPGPREKV